jgi:hypothetical protein
MSSDLKEQLQSLKEKRLVVRKRQKLCQEQVDNKRKVLAAIMKDAQDCRSAAIRNHKVALDRLLGTPPARNGYEDAQRLATTLIRPLTQHEAMIYAAKSNGFNWAIAAFSRAGLSIMCKDIQQLRLQVYRDWESEKRFLQREIERLSREFMEDHEPQKARSIKQQLTELQREITWLELQADFIEVDLKSVEQRLYGVKP